MLRLAIRIRQVLAPRMALLLVPPLFWLVWMVWAFPGLDSPEALDYAQVARHVSRGDGFVTSAIMPLSLALVPRLDGHPSLSHPPVFVLWEALFFRLSGARQSLAALASGVPWGLALWLIYALTSRLFDRKAALLGVGLFVVNLPCLRSSVSGMPPLLAGTILAALFMVLAGPAVADGKAAAPTRLPWGRLAATATLAGLAILCDYSLLWAATLPLFIFWVRWPRWAGLAMGDMTTGTKRNAGRRRALPVLAGLVFAAAVALTVSPWLVRNYRVAGHPLAVVDRYDLLTQTREYPGLTVYRRFNPLLPQPWEYTNRHPVQVLRKGLQGLASLSREGGSLVGVLIVTLFVLACLRPPAGNVGRVQRYFLLSLLVYTIGLSFTSQRLDRLIAFVPVMTVFAAGATTRLLGMLSQAAEEITGAPWWARRKAAPLWAIWALAALPLLGDRANAQKTNRLVPSANIKYLSENTPKGTAVMTDAPWLVAWYGDRPAVWLAQDANELSRLESQVGRLSWLYFSRYRTLMGSDVATWWVIALRAPEGYKSFQPHQSLDPTEVLRKSDLQPSQRAASAAGASPLAAAPSEGDLLSPPGTARPTAR